MAGSLASFLLAVKVLAVNPPAVLYWIIPMAVWVVYTLDHLADGISLKQEASTFRHRLHFKNRKIILSLLIITATIALGLAIVELPSDIIFFGIILGTAVLAYQIAIFFLGRKNRLFLSKEIIIAIIYTAGIWGSPILLTDRDLQFDQGIILFLFLLIAFCNTTLLSYFEYAHDRNSSQVSFSIQFGKNKTCALLKYLLLGVALICLAILIIPQRTAVSRLAIFIMFLMSSLMLTMILQATFFQKKDRYKILIEAVFLLPLLIMLQ